MADFVPVPRREEGAARPLEPGVVALLGGVIADLYGLRTAVAVVAAITAGSGLLVAVRMYETHQPGANELAERPT